MILKHTQIFHPFSKTCKFLLTPTIQSNQIQDASLKQLSTFHEPIICLSYRLAEHKVANFQELLPRPIDLHHRSVKNCSHINNTKKHSTTSVLHPTRRSTNENTAGMLTDDLSGCQTVPGSSLVHCGNPRWDADDLALY